MKTRLKIILSVAGVVAAVSLLLVKTDREFINLTPSPGGAENSVVLETGHTYSQTFPATRTTISRIGLYLRPQVRSLPKSAVSIKILTDGQLRAEQHISTSFIDVEGVSEVRLNQPILVNIGEEITLTVTVPAELSGQVRVLTRSPDDGKAQTATLAYQVYYMYRPPLAWQVSGVFLISILWLWFPKILSSQKGNYVLGILLACLYTLPAFLLGSFPWVVILVVALAFGVMSWFLRRFSLSAPAVVLGASIFAFTWQWTSFPILNLITFSLSFLAAQGLSALQNFLGKDTFITALCWIIVLLVLLDLFHVGAGTLEFPLI